MKQVTAAVIANRQVMPGTHLIWLSCPQLDQAEPGQFVMLRCEEECVLPRPLSIHQLADGAKLALLFSVVGKGTRWLAQRQVGDRVELVGPLGNGYSIHPESHQLLLVAGGVGIAPLAALASSASKQGYSVKILLGAQTSSQLYPSSLLPAGIELVTATEDGSAGNKGMITGLLPDFAGWADQTFACGPLPMYQAMAAMPALKDQPVQVSLEVRMGCGRGVCYGCTVKTTSGLKQACRDGPVFDLAAVLWGELNCC